MTLKKVLCIVLKNAILRDIPQIHFDIYITNKF